jgi:hypothetical protein
MTGRARNESVSKRPLLEKDNAYCYNYREKIKSGVIFHEK